MIYLTVFGNNASFPQAYGACACYLVEACGKKILLDMGSGSLSQLLRAEDIAKLDMIVLSHMHFDHMGDLFCAKYQLETRRAWGEAVPKIPLLAPPMPQWARQELGAGEVFDICAVEDGASLSLGDIRMTFMRMEHLVESYGLRLYAGQKILAYSADTGLCPQLSALAKNADAFLCEATLTGEDGAEQSHHLSAAAAGALAANSHAKRLLLTYYHEKWSRDVLQQAREFFSTAELTHIGTTYAI